MRRCGEPAQRHRGQGRHADTAWKLIAHHDRHVQPIIDQQLAYLRRGIDRNLEAKLRMPGSQIGQHPRQNRMGHGLGHAKTHDTRHHTLRQLTQNAITLSHQYLGLVDQSPARRGQAYAAPVTLEDRDFHPILEMPDTA